MTSFSTSRITFTETPTFEYNGYAYHELSSSGTLTATSPGTFDVLLVGGGGGGGDNNAGGGAGGDNTGGGGGAGAYSTGNGGAGGSGIVVIRHKI